MSDNATPQPFTLLNGNTIGTYSICSNSIFGQKQTMHISFFSSEQKKKKKKKSIAKPLQ